MKLNNQPWIMVYTIFSIDERLRQHLDGQMKVAKVNQ